MILGIDPKVDYAFKLLLGRDETRAILIDVIDKVLNPPTGRHIRDIELMNPFNPKEAFDDKLSILDVKARDQSGRQFNLEMQMLGSPNYDKRVVYYWARLHQQQLHQGEDYLTLQPTISISFLNHVMFPDVPDYHMCFRLLERTHGFALTGDVEFHIFELPKFKKSATELKTGLDCWLYFFRHAETIDTEALPPILQQHPLVLQAIEVLKMLSQTDLERERYEARRKAQLDFNTGMKGARLEGLEAGRLEGQKIGIIQICEALLNRPQTPIDQLTGLSFEELTRLADELQAQVGQR